MTLDGGSGRPSVTVSQHTSHLLQCRSHDEVIGRPRCARTCRGDAGLAKMVGVPPQAASADQSATSRPRPIRIAAKIDQLNDTIEQYAEAANGAQVGARPADPTGGRRAVQGRRREGQIKQHRRDCAATPSTPTCTAPTTSRRLRPRPDLRPRPTPGLPDARIRQPSAAIIDQLRARRRTSRSRSVSSTTRRRKAEAKKKDLDSKKAQRGAAVEKQNSSTNQAQGRARHTR